MLLTQSIKTVPGIGEKTAESLAKLKINQVRDILLHLPMKVVSRQLMPDITRVQHGDQVILRLKILSFDQVNYKLSRRKPCRIFCLYGDTPVSLVYFNFYPNYMLEKLKANSFITVCGKIEISAREISLVHPEVSFSERPNFSPIYTVYPLTKGISNSQLQKYVEQVLLRIRLPDEEWIPSELINKNKWLSLSQSLLSLHRPTLAKNMLIFDPERRRLAYDELLANQISVHKFRQSRKKAPGRSFVFSGTLSAKALAELNFELTPGQQQALEEIMVDQRSDHQMYRLVQGDVGCGKTLVALLAIFNILESGECQAAFMAPTDLLATQHYNWVKPILAKYGFETSLLTGKITGKKRQEILANIASGQSRVVIGTHALFQEHVHFSDLGLVIIDEQHRFGVDQRSSLINKGKDVDILFMTATPIPRTLTLALYGDMEISQIMDKPKGRMAIDTLVFSSKKITDLVESFSNLIAKDERIYWVCPQIEESEDEGGDKIVSAAIERYKHLSSIFPGMVGLVHGQMPAAEKEENLLNFAQGITKILVSTTVIEVGINIPEATIMIIEEAQKFGLSQLHQLRGRIGRGSKKSYCMLLYSYPISDIGRSRLDCLKKSNDGFYIAEQDLILRGSGDLAGKKQSGFPDFKIALMPEDGELLILANKQAKSIVENGNLSPELQFLLTLFDYQDTRLG